MTTLLNIALINSVAVLPLAVLAIVFCRLARRPALTHAVWVLVLLKFVTPPLFPSPVTIEVPAETWATRENHVSATTRRPPSSNPASDELLPATASLVTRAEISSSDSVSSATAKPVTSSSRPVVRRGGPSVVASPLQSLVTSWTRRSDLRSMLLIGWLCGVAMWMAVQFVRAVRFQRRVVRNAKSNDELQQQTEQLAAALGLRRGPRVLVVNAAVSPMLWGCGSRAKLLFPSDLAERLDANARATLLTHELAHFARGDHWVRLLELIATGLFWWHPVVWWARRQIEEAEEECCDAWGRQSVSRNAPPVR